MQNEQGIYMSKSTSQNLDDSLENFDNAMLVTRDPANQLSARPMHIAERRNTVELTFVADIDSDELPGREKLTR